MKHIVALTLIVFLAYFGWCHLPESAKDALRRFSGDHLFKVAALLLLIWLAFVMQAVFGSGKIF